MNNFAPSLTTQPRLPSLKPLIASLMLAVASPALWAQTTAAPQAGQNSTAVKPGTATAPAAKASPATAPATASATTKPAAMPGPYVPEQAVKATPVVRTVSAKAPRPAANAKTTRDTLYAPIQKPDDDGQIPEIQMFVGESRVFPAPNVARIVVGNGQVMSATALDGKEIIIFGNAVGTTTLFVWNEDGRYQRVKVNIMQGDVSRVAREVAAFMTAIPNAKVSIVGDKVIVEGDALSDEDRDKVAELSKRYPQIVNFTSAVGWEKMVMMDVKVVEFPKSELRELGLKWTANGGAAIGTVWGPIRRGNNGPYQVGIPAGDNGLPITDIPPDGAPNPNGGGGVTIPQSLNLIGALNLGLSARLNMLAQNGTASVLAEPQLSARSGVKASFLAGGEYPYAVTTIQGPSVQFKQYGIKLDVEPRIGRDGIIRAVIDSEVSSIDQSVITAAGPALLTRRTKTEFNARSGETIVLSGLLQRNISSDIDKVPGLGNIPVIGALFRSKRYQNKETELVVFVTPTIVDAHSPGLVDRVNKTTERLSERLDKSPYLSDPLQPGKDAHKFNQGPGAQAPRPAPATNQAPAPAPSAGQPPFAANNPPAAQTLLVLREGLVLRDEPSDASVALMELGYHAIVDAGPLEAPGALAGKWRHVTVGGVKGWVRADNVSPVDQQGALSRKVAAGTVPTQAPQPVTATQTGAGQYRVVLDGLAVHVSPDVNSLVVAKLGGNQVVNGAAAPKGSWMPIESGAVRGWVAAQWLQNTAMAN